MKRLALVALVLTGTAAASSATPVGLWRADWDKTRIYRWVAISTGYEERSQTPHRLKSNHCLVRKGDLVYRYVRASSRYKVWEHQWADKGCAKSWELMSYTVKLKVTRTTLTLYCSDKRGVCWSYTRISSGRGIRDEIDARAQRLIADLL